MNSVDEALNTPASELISAASSPATTMPRMPAGSTCLHHQRERRLRDRRRSRCRSRRPAAAAPAFVPLRASARQIMPGMMKMNTGSSFRIRGEDRPAPRLGLVRRAQRALHDVLIGAPVPEADDRRAEQHAEPGVVAVEVPARCRARSPSPAPSALHPAGTSGFHRLNMSVPTIARSSPQPPSASRP